MSRIINTIGTKKWK